MADTSVPVTRWDEKTWRGAVERVRAGRALAPAQWPGDARVAVALSFDPDHETVALRTGSTAASALSELEYGSRVGARRVLKLLDRYSAPATFFMPAVSALLHPDEIRDYAAAGHELAMHSWIHELDPGPWPAEKELIARSADTLELLSGQRPVGYRTANDKFSPNTVSVLVELGARYDSSLMADDDCYELLVDGEPCGLVEVPPDWIRDDAPYLVMGSKATGLSGSPYTPPRELLTVWTDEFDQAYADGGLFQMMMHPHIIGHRSRMVVLDELMAHIAGHEGVWFATHAQVADYVRDHAGPQSS